MVRPDKATVGDVVKLRAFVVALLLEEPEVALCTITAEGCSGLTIVRELTAKPERLVTKTVRQHDLSFQRSALGLLQLLLRVQHSTNTMAVNSLLASVLHNAAFLPRCLELLCSMLNQRSFADTPKSDERARYGEAAWMGPTNWSDAVLPVWHLVRLACERYRDLTADEAFLSSVQSACERVLTLGPDALSPLAQTRTEELLRLMQRSLRDMRRATEPIALCGVRATARAVPLPLDRPGAESNEGPRHDNDHADFRAIAVMPTAAELLALREPFVPPNCAAYTDTVDQYLDMQFRLLREDLLNPLRSGLQQFRAAGGVRALGARDFFMCGGAGAREQSGKLLVSRQVKFVSLRPERNKPLLFEVEFNPNSRVANMKPKERKAFWENSKKLKGGSLLVLWSDGPTGPAATAADSEPSICVFRVADRNPDDLSRNRPKLRLSCDVSMVALAMRMLAAKSEVVLLELNIGYLEVQIERARAHACVFLWCHFLI